MSDTWQDIEARWQDGPIDAEGESLYRYARKDILALCAMIEANEAQSVIDLLQDDEFDIRLKNINLVRILIWSRGEWLVKDSHSNKTIMITSDLATAIKWLKGEE